MSDTITAHVVQHDASASTVAGLPALSHAPVTATELTKAPSTDFLNLIPRDFARRHIIISAGLDEQTELLRCDTSTDPAAIYNTGVTLGRAVRVTIDDPEAIATDIDRAYSPTISANESDSSTGMVQAADVAGLIAKADQDLLWTSGKGPTVRLVDALLFEAITRNASDVHIQPLADRTLVRYRIDGVLVDAHELSPAACLGVISRVKVMGRMDVAERRVPQDGRASVRLGASESSRSVDLRISAFPTAYGERIVLRLLDTAQAAHLQDFASLGMPADLQSMYLDRANRASGIVLVTGPTGSGKTTTLYATLKWIADHGEGRWLNIMTIEDPIEYELSSAGLAVSQSQVNTKKGVSFANGLRHILRQDPDVIMVGEIRDMETARIAIQASLTGHLVFSTLHTNDAIGAITRLIELGVEAYLVAASLSAVLAQRLVRRVHTPCAARGCPDCNATGYKGRAGVFELLPVGDELRAMISRGARTAELHPQARSRGFRTLMEEGSRLIAEGITSEMEVARVVHGFE